MQPDETKPLPQAQPRSSITTQSRTGTTIRPPPLQNPALIRLAPLWSDNEHYKVTLFATRVAHYFPCRSCA